MALDRLLGMTVFRRAVELGSLAAAGRVTGVSAEMAGQHLKALETRLGVRLLSRTTRRLSLTEAGQAYYQRCVAALDEIELADAEAGARQMAPSGRLRITAPLGFSNTILAPLVSSFLDLHPDLAIDIDLSEHKADLLADGFDLALRLGNLSSSSLMARRLGSVPLILAASPDYLARAGVPIHPHDLACHEVLIYAQTATPNRWRFGGCGGESASVDIKGRVTASDVEFLLRLTLLGRGLILAPSFMLADHLCSGTVVEVLSDWRERTLPLHVLWPHRTLVPATTRAFVDFLAAQIDASLGRVM